MIWHVTNFQKVTEFEAIDLKMGSCFGNFMFEYRSGFDFREKEYLRYRIYWFSCLIYQAVGATTRIYYALWSKIWLLWCFDQMTGDWLSVNIGWFISALIFCWMPYFGYWFFIHPYFWSINHLIIKNIPIFTWFLIEIFKTFLI